MEFDIYRWCFEINLDDVRKEDVEETPNDCCFLCGKKINKVEQVVHYLTNGNLISTDQDIDNSQGFFPIGNECKKRLPNNFYFKV
jgi:hypothetical protein